MNAETDVRSPRCGASHTRRRMPYGSTPPEGLVAFTTDDGEHALLCLPESPPGSIDALTHAEIAVARLVVAGKSTAEIARDRRRSERTVANQIASIFRKLRIASRAELASEFSEPVAAHDDFGGLESRSLASCR